MPRDRAGAGGQKLGRQRGKARGCEMEGGGTGMEDKLQAPWNCCIRGKCSLRNVCSSFPLNKYLYIHLPAGAHTWLLTSRPE